MKRHPLRAAPWPRWRRRGDIGIHRWGEGRKRGGPSGRRRRRSKVKVEANTTAISGARCAQAACFEWAVAVGLGLARTSMTGQRGQGGKAGDVWWRGCGKTCKCVKAMVKGQKSRRSRCSARCSSRASSAAQQRLSRGPVAKPAVAAAVSGRRIIPQPLNSLQPATTLAGTRASFWPSRWSASRAAPLI